MRYGTVLRRIERVSAAYARDVSGRDLARAALACGHSITVTLPEGRRRIKCTTCSQTHIRRDHMRDRSVDAAKALSCLPQDATEEEKIARLLAVGGECAKEGLRRLMAHERAHGRDVLTVAMVAGHLGVRS